MVSEKQVIGKLKECIDPELGLNIVDLGFVYGVKASGKKVEVDMTLSTPGCPMSAFFVRDVEEKLRALKGVEEVKVNFVFDPPWTPGRMSAEAKKKLFGSS